MAEDEKPGTDSAQEPDAVLADETPEDAAEVEGQALSVEEFNADGRSPDVVCGAYYSDN
jgi:hypothetical protein